MNAPIVHQAIEIDAPADQVWPFVATEAGLRQWWGSEIHLEAKEGGQCTECVVIQGQTIAHHGVVTRYDPPHGLTLTFEPAPPQPGNPVMAYVLPMLTSISITLDEAAGRTRVAVMHQVLHWAPAHAPHPPTTVESPFGPQMRTGLSPAATLRPPITQHDTPTRSNRDQDRLWIARLQTLQYVWRDHHVGHA